MWIQYFVVDLFMKLDQRWPTGPIFHLHSQPQNNDCTNSRLYDRIVQEL